MKYRYRYLDEMIEMIEGQTDEAHKMAVIWANQDQPNLQAFLALLYDHRANFEIGGVPKYNRNRNGGIEMHSALEKLESTMNTKLMGADGKFKNLVNVLNQLQDRDAELLVRALRGQVDLGLPVEQIQRVYPQIKSDRTFAEDAPVAKVLSNLTFPGTVVRQPPGHEVKVYINQTGNFKFVDNRGRGLVLPDKPNSAFVPYFSKLRNIVLSCAFHGLTKDKSKVGNTATTNAAFAKFRAGELESETFAVRILDAIDIYSHNNYPANNPVRAMAFADRRDWILKQDWGDTIHISVADTVEIADLEELRKKFENEVYETKDTLRYYANDSTYGDGYHILTKDAF